MTLSNELNALNNKDTNALGDYYDAHINEAHFIDKLCKCILVENDSQIAATWLVKHHVDQGHALHPKQIEELLISIPFLEDWQAQLHVLQLIPRFEMNQKQASQLAIHIDDFIYSDYKFVKAAAYEAKYKIGQHFPELIEELRQQCELALQKESASVKVKARRILAALEKESR